MPSEANPSSCFSSNITGTHNVLIAAREEGVQRFASELTLDVPRNKEVVKFIADVREAQAAADVQTDGAC